MEKEGKKHQCVVASRMTPTGTWPTIQACALTGKRTSNPLVLVSPQTTEPHQPGLT